jgi:predicted NAD-dependent protein-ADP-ribosyltransferase YbiA (DUF1768 family)
MAVGRRTYRIVDDERIEGVWRPVFIRNGPSYFLSDLLTYADGAIYCWEWVDLDGLRELVERGRIATHLEPGARASEMHLGSWTFGEPETWVTAEDLLGEVADAVDELNDRPDSTGRARLALDRYLERRTESDRQALRDAYLAIPEHRRHFMLGDMDAKDQPVRVLCTPVGERTTYDELVTEEMHTEALAYFADRLGSIEERRRNRPVEAPEQPRQPTVVLATIPGRWPEQPAIEWLRNEYPVPIVIGGETYASAVHAYWGLATTDDATRAKIHDTRYAMGVERAVGAAPIRPDWPDIRTAAMHAILRAKFGQHPELADFLVGTGDARIEYAGFGSAHWGSGAGGRNWAGRLLELVRSELAAERAGFTP